MDRLVFLVIRVRQEYGRELVERHHAVRLRIGDRLEPRGRLERGRIRLAMFERAEQREPERGGPHVETGEREAQGGAELRPERLDVAHFLQVAADVG